MNKKLSTIFILFAILGFLTCSNSYAVSSANYDINHKNMKKEFETRLNLSTKQKEMARTIHKKGKDEIKPLMLSIEIKQNELNSLNQNSKDKAIQEQISKLKQDISSLEKQAQDVRKKNSQDFEKILNKKQKNELQKMKEEGRLRFEKTHPARPPFQGLGTSGFLLRPLLPPNK